MLEYFTPGYISSAGFRFEGNPVRVNSLEIVSLLVLVLSYTWCI